MKLKSAAKFFDDTEVYEAYTQEYLWSCQFSSFNDANVVGSTSTRRTLSLAPDLLLPERRAIKIFDDVWVVGDGNPDSWKGAVIRQSFNMKKANAYVDLLSPSDAALGQSGVKTYTQKIYFKDTVNSLNNAEYDPQWNFFFAPGEPVVKGTFIREGSRLYRVRSEYLPLEDLRVGQSDEVDQGPLPAVFHTGSYDPISDSYLSGDVNTFIILMDFTKLYTYLTKASERQAAGDVNGLVPKSAVTPKISMVVTIAGLDWKVLSFTDELDSWLLHLRRA